MSRTQRDETKKEKLYEPDNKPWSSTIPHRYGDDADNNDDALPSRLYDVRSTFIADKRTTPLENIVNVRLGTWIHANQLKLCLTKIIDYHVHTDHQVKRSCYDALERDYVTFFFYPYRDIYVLKLYTSLEEDSCDHYVCYDASRFVDILFVCRALNPHEKMCYFEGDGIMYSYCQTVTTPLKADIVYPLQGIHVYCNVSEGMTWVQFYSLKQHQPVLKACFTF